MKYKLDELVKPHPEVAKIFEKHGIPKLPLPTPETLPVMRKRYAATMARNNSSSFAVKAMETTLANRTWIEKDYPISVRDGSSIKVRVYTPNSPAPSEGGAPLAFVAHGGGWCMGDLDTEALLCRTLCVRFGLVVVNVGFRLYPDVDFPVPIHDCYDALKWVAANASELKADPTKGFLVGGNSGGGTYSQISVYLARDEGLVPQPTGCFLLCPIFTDETNDDAENPTHKYPGQLPSLEQNKDAPLMNRNMQLSIYKLTRFEPCSPLLSPLFFEDHAGMPKTYIQVCGLDPWRDAGSLYSKLLSDAGVQTHLDVFPGLPHCWWTTYTEMRATEEWLIRLLKGVSWLLAKDGNASKEAMKVKL